MKQDITEELELPEGVTIQIEGRNVTATGPAGTITRALGRPEIMMKVEGNKIVLAAVKATQREKRHLNTMRSHFRNMMRGTNEPHMYQLKICSGHFPMNVKLSNGTLTVKNFLGESVPRVLKIKAGVEVKHEGDIITVSSPDIELAGAQASDIEQLTRISNRDRRIFQDGIYITTKDGDEL